MVLLLCLCLLAICQTAEARLHITLLDPARLNSLAVSGPAIRDAQHLLTQAFPAARVSLNQPGADIVLQLPVFRLKNRTYTVAVNALIPQPALPDRSYAWRSKRQGRRLLLRLEARSTAGVACGLYGLLQEQLGIRFIHPRQTSIPHYTRWPLKPAFSFSAQPRFAYQGFHLHTLHPIELTEQLHDPAYPNGFEDLTAYLDWLARNGQNSFQFFLLRGIDRTTWLPHARRIVAYAHQRGIACGVEISLAMLQQQAFQALTLLRPIPGYSTQVEQTLAWLFQVPWDFITLEAMMGEHLPLVSLLLPTAQRHLEQLVAHTYHRPLLYATHVIRQNKAVRRPLCPESGILIHTVMCYSASEAKAPVYGNCNQRFMLKAAQAEQQHRLTWYWPESSYWVGFDSPVPLLLLPYLSSRLDDINVMAQLGLAGHLTFSSGWEWGYWLIDWSIARWSWRYRQNGRLRSDTALSGLNDLLPDPALGRLWQQALQLQNQYLKDHELLRFMAAALPFAELPEPFRLPFQPTPDFTYGWLLKRADQAQASAIAQGPVTRLEQYGVAMGQLTAQLRQRIRLLQQQHRLTGDRAGLADELVTALQVTSLRAQHRSLTLRALIAKRRSSCGGLAACQHYLSRAQLVRAQAQVLVTRQEQRYRYPINLLARRRSSLTAYPFGYLYPASRLFFWEREEQQVQQGRFDPFFMNLWDVWRTLGLKSLFSH